MGPRRRPVLLQYLRTMTMLLQDQGTRAMLLQDQGATTRLFQDQGTRMDLRVRILPLLLPPFLLLLPVPLRQARAKPRQQRLSRRMRERGLTRLIDLFYRNLFE